MANRAFSNVKLNVKLEKASVRSNIGDNENIAISLGKIWKWYEDFDPIAWSGHPTITRKDTTSSQSADYKTSFTVIDSVNTNNDGHVTGVNKKTITLPEAIPGPKGDKGDPGSDATVSIETTGSGNAITAASLSSGKITFTKGSTFLTAHPTITKSTDSTSTATPAAGGTFTAVDSVTRDSNGHVTKINTKTVTLPTQASFLLHIKVDDTTLHNTAGTFAFSGAGEPWPGTDWVGMQIGDNVDKFQIRASGNRLLFRQNDNGGTNTSWNDWVNLLTPSDIKAGSNISLTLSTAETKTVTINATNTTYTFATGDANGQFKVTPSSGSAYNVSIKGLGSAAYTASTSYLASTTKYALGDAVGGNAVKANQLTTARTINGVSFNGTANITIPRSCKYVHHASGTGGVAGWIKIAQMQIKATYNNTPYCLTISQRGNTITYRLHIQWANANSTDPTLNKFILSSDENWQSISPRAYMIKTAAGAWDLYILKLDSYESIDVVDFTNNNYYDSHMTLTWVDVQTDASAITGGTEATKKVYSTTDHTHNYAGSASAGGPATTVQSTLHNPTDAALSLVGIPFFSATPSTGGKTIYTNNGLRFSTLEGTATALGYGLLVIGNGAGSGSAGNKNGQIRIYGDGTGYTTLKSANTSTSSYNITFPAATGTVALTGHTHAAGDITSGTLPVARGGTGATTFTSNAVLCGNTTNAVKSVATANGAAYATSANGTLTFGTLPIAQGGTGKTSALAAITALGGASILSQGTNIPDGSDLNTYITPGTYYVAASANTSTIANVPRTGAGFKLIVEQDYSTNYRRQIAYSGGNTAYMFVRTTTDKGATWSNWVSISTSAHTHSYLPLAGGTMTGTINSTTADVVIGTYGGYKTYFRQDGNNFYILKSDQNGTTWNSARPLTINHVTGICNINGNAGTATKLSTARTLTIGSSGKTFDGSANVTWTLTDIGAAASGHTHNYLPLSGGTMTGSITLNTGSVTLIQKLNETSNYGYAIKWYKGGVSQNTYDPSIGHHNTGGDGTGSITILPYATATTPWSGSVGLFITKGQMKLDGKVVEITDSKVTQSNSTTSNFRPLLLGYQNSTDASTLATTTTNQVYANVAIYAKPSTGAVYATDFYTSGVNNSTSYSRLAALGLYSRASYTKSDGTANAYTGYLARVWQGKGMDNNGALATFGFGGLTIIGSGESHTNLAGLISDDQSASGATKLDVSSKLATQLTATSEQLLLASDNNIYFIPACNTIANRVAVVLSTGKAFYPDAANTGSLGTSSYRWGLSYIDCISTPKVTSTHLAGNQTGALIQSTASAGSYVMLSKMNSTNGYFTHGGWQDKYVLQYTAKTTVDAGTNSVTKSVTLLNEAGNSSFPGTVTASTFSGSGASLTSLNAGNISTGTLAIERGGTGSGTAAGARGNLGAMAAISANGYYGMARPDGTDNVWIRTTSQGIIPYESGAAGSGHCSLGTSTWYFKNAYIDTVHGSLSGNASTATKWAAAKTITLSQGLQGSVSIDGSANVTLNGALKRCIICDESEDFASYAWHKFAETTITSNYGDASITFLVSKSWGQVPTVSGILTAHVRSSSTKIYESGQFVWQVASSGIVPDDFVMVYTNTANTSVKVELWYKQGSRYDGWVFTVLKEHSRTTYNSVWTLYTSTGHGSANRTTGTGSVVSSAPAILNASPSATTATKLGSATVGSTSRPIYLNSGTATQCATPASGAWFAGVPQVGSNGVMEIGKYIDFHGTTASTNDYDYRINTSTTAMSLTAQGASNTLTISGADSARLSFGLTASGKAYTATGVLVYPLTTSGSTMLIQGGGNTVVGGGEFATGAYSRNYDNISTTENEKLYLGADGEVQIISNGQNIATTTNTSHRVWKFNTSGNTVLPTNGSILFTGSNYSGTLTSETLTAARTWTLPNRTGNLMVASDQKLLYKSSSWITDEGVTITSTGLFTNYYYALITVEDYMYMRGGTGISFQAIIPLQYVKSIKDQPSSGTTYDSNRFYITYGYNPDATFGSSTITSPYAIGIYAQYVNDNSIKIGSTCVVSNGTNGSIWRIATTLCLYGI